MRNNGQGSEQPQQMQDAVSVLSTTLNMITRDFDRMEPAAIRELAWVAKYEADRLIDAVRPGAVGRRIMLAESW